MRLKHIYIILVGLLFYACDGQTKKNICTSDIAIKKIGGINKFLQQQVDEKCFYENSIEAMKEAVL